MNSLARDVAEALDPVVLARRIGWIPDEWQAKVLRSDAPRQAMAAHRQFGKSQVAALKSIHTAAYRPGSLVLVVSPSQRQSQELFRRILEMWEAMGRPVPADSENTTSMALANGSRILALPGDPQTVRGLAKVTLLCIDEAAYVSDALATAVRPMLAVARGQMLAISTPAGRRGWWFRACTEPNNGWEVTTVRASESGRLSQEYLDAERADMTSIDYAQEYEVQFLDGAGSLFAAEDVLAAVCKAEQPFDPDAAPDLVVEAEAVS